MKQGWGTKNLHDSTDLGIKSAESLLKELQQEKRRLIKERLLLNSKEIKFSIDDDTPFSIPTNWIWVKLNDVSIIQEGPGIRKFQYQNEGIQFLTVTNILEDSVDLEKSKKYISIKEFEQKYSHFKINKNDIVTACSGGSWGKTALYEHDDVLILNTSTLRLRFFGDLGDNKYLYYLTKADFFKAQIADQLSGQQPNFGYSHYSKVKIPLPPLVEQQRIVAILDEAFDAIARARANAGQNLKNARELFESYLQSVFENKGEGWEEKSLGEFAVFRNGMNFTKSSKGDEIKIVGVKDFQKSFWVPLKNLDSVIIDGTLNEIDILKKGDIVTVRSNGNPQLIGRTLLTGDVSEKITHSGFTIRIRLSSNIVSPVYLCTYLKTPKAIKALIESGNGVGIKSLNQGTLSSLLIPFPKSLSEQQTIVQKLDSLSTETKKLEAVYGKKIADLEELKKSLLQKAFKGELRGVREAIDVSDGHNPSDIKAVLYE